VLGGRCGVVGHELDDGAVGGDGWADRDATGRPMRTVSRGAWGLDWVIRP
jgi:hypothetical protein